MPSITNALVRVKDEKGPALRADCFGNNAAVECPCCRKYPVLLIALENQRGSSSRNPARCRSCGAKVYILNKLDEKKIEVVDVGVVNGDAASRP